MRMIHGHPGGVVVVYRLLTTKALLLLRFTLRFSRVVRNGWISRRAISSSFPPFASLATIM